MDTSALKSAGETLISICGAEVFGRNILPMIAMGSSVMTVKRGMGWMELISRQVTHDIKSILLVNCTYYDFKRLKKHLIEEKSEWPLSRQTDYMVEWRINDDQYVTIQIPCNDSWRGVFSKLIIFLK